MRRGCSRILAGLMCLCMMLTLFGASAPVLADDAYANHYDDTDMRVYVIHWHPDGDKMSQTNQMFTMTSGNGFVGNEDNIVFSDGVATIHPVPQSDERFTSFSVTAGRDAVTITNAEVAQNSEAKVEYNPNIHLVKIHVFYSSSGDERDGYNFGSKMDKDNDPEVDTTEMSEDDYEDLKNGKEISSTLESSSGTDDSMVKVYDTSMGLHTDKTVVESPLYNDEDDTNKFYGNETGSRTFDVTLESWYADQNLADVGLVLDASGSMAFASSLENADGGSDGDVVTVDSKCFSSLDEVKADKTIEQQLTDNGGIAFLTQAQVDQILCNNYTDNSLLNYSDYSYFVYDAREGTKEYVPLGYWDGTGFDKYGTLNEGLIGHYSFNNSMNNTAPGKETVATTTTGDPYESESPNSQNSASAKLYSNNKR